METRRCVENLSGCNCLVIYQHLIRPISASQQNTLKVYPSAFANEVARDLWRIYIGGGAFVGFGETEDQAWDNAADNIARVEEWRTVARSRWPNAESRAYAEYFRIYTSRYCYVATARLESEAWREAALTALFPATKEHCE